MKQWVLNKLVVALPIELDGQLKAYHILFKLIGIKKKKKALAINKIWDMHFSSTNKVYMEYRMWEIGCAYKIYIYM